MKLKGFFVLGAALGMLALAAAAPPAMAAVSVGFSIHAGDPYHGFSLHLSSAPNLVYVPGTSVGYVQNYDGDLYCYGNQWYLAQGDQWYCGSSYDGPFFEISASSLPFDVSRFPGRYQGGGAFYGQQTFSRDNDPASYDRDRSYRSYDRGWNSRDNSGSAGTYGNEGWDHGNQGWSRGNQGWSHSNQGWNRGNQGWSRGNQGWSRGNEGWNRGQGRRGSRYSGGRFSGRDRDGDGD